MRKIQLKNMLARMPVLMPRRDFAAHDALFVGPYIEEQVNYAGTDAIASLDFPFHRDMSSAVSR